MVHLHERLRLAADRPVATVKSVVEQARSDDVPFMAASIAYQAFASLVPILVLLFLAVTTVGGQGLATRVVELTEGFLPDAAQSLLSEAIAGRTGFSPTGASLVGLVVLVWGSLKIFRGLDKAFTEIYGTEAENSLLDQLRDGVVVFAVLALALVAMVAAGTLFSVLEGPSLRFANLAVLLAGLTVAFLPVYRYFPDADLSWTDAIPGAVFAAVGWTLLQFLFQFYVAFSGRGSASTAIGAVLLLLVWLYLAGLVLLLGGVLSAVLLGEGGPSPKAGSNADRLHDVARALHRERDRRQTLEHETARLERKLGDVRPDEIGHLERRNQLLQRRLRWERRPWPVRVVLGLVGDAPPDPTAVTDSPGRQEVRPLVVRGRD